jgi:hypothetical protein
MKIPTRIDTPNIDIKDKNTGVELAVELRVSLISKRVGFHLNKTISPLSTKFLICP